MTPKSKEKSLHYHELAQQGVADVLTAPGSLHVRGARSNECNNGHTTRGGEEEGEFNASSADDEAESRAERGNR